MIDIHACARYHAAKAAKSAALDACLAAQIAAEDIYASTVGEFDEWADYDEAEAVRLAAHAAAIKIWEAANAAIDAEYGH